MKCSEIVIVETSFSKEHSIIQEDFDSKDQLRVERRIHDFYSKYNIDVEFNPHAFIRINTRTLDEDSSQVSDWIQYFFLKLFGSTPEQIMKFRTDIQRQTMLFNFRNPDQIVGVKDTENRTFRAVEKSPIGVTAIFTVYYPGWSEHAKKQKDAGIPQKIPYNGEMKINIRTIYFDQDSTSEDQSTNSEWPVNVDISKRPSFNEFLKNNNMTKKDDVNAYYGHYKKIRPKAFDRFERALLNILESNNTLYKGLNKDKAKLNDAIRKKSSNKEIQSLKQRVAIGEHLAQYANEAKNKMLNFLNNPGDPKLENYKFSRDETGNLSLQKMWGKDYSTNEQIRPSKFFPKNLMDLQKQHDQLRKEIINSSEDQRQELTKKMEDWYRDTNYNYVINKFADKAEELVKSITELTRNEISKSAQQAQRQEQQAQQQLAQQKSIEQQKIQAQNNARQELINNLGYDESDAAEYKSMVADEITTLTKKLEDKNQEYNQWKPYANNPDYKDNINKIKLDFDNIQKQLQQYKQYYELFKIGYPQLQESVISESVKATIRSKLNSISRIKELSGLL